MRRGILALALMITSGCETPVPRNAPSSTTPSPAPSEIPTPAPWLPIFDGRSLDGWESVTFGGEGEVRVERGEIHLDMGEPLTGARYTGDLLEILPRSREGYELRLRAQRLRGNDFFCGLTFPVGVDGGATLICGGWGGSLLGISSLDDLDASQNHTTKYVRFERGRWYRIRVRVTRERIECWLDETLVVEVVRANHDKIWVRAEVEPTVPLGISSYLTHGAVKDIEVRDLSPGG